MLQPTAAYLLPASEPLFQIGWDIRFGRPWSWYIPDMEYADAVVIGAGHNGLVAANLLADAGWDVIVLEATAQPGGAVHSTNSLLPGYVTDLCAAFFPLGAGSPVLRALRLEEHGLRWRHAPAVLAHLFPDDRAAVLSRDLERTAASLEEFAPGDGERWARAYHQWQELGPHLLDALFSGFPPVRATSRLALRLGAAGTLRFARQLLLPVRRLGRELFNGEGARILLSGSAMHTDLSPDALGSGVFGWLLAMLGQQVGFPAVEGGAQGLTNALIARLQRRGGAVICDALVERILIARGRAMGVATKDGHLWRARRAVIADVPAPVLYRDLVGPNRLPTQLIADLEHFQWDNAILKVDWALSSQVPWVNPLVSEAGTVHLGVDEAGLARAATDLANGEVPRQPFVIVGQMSTTDPTRSPAGTETLWTYTHLPRDLGSDPATVESTVARLEELLERHAPGFREIVVDRAVFSPADMAHANPSLIDGTINGGTAALYQQLIFRPVPGLGRADTPIDRLYLASSSAHPGGGAHGGPGANAARAALARAHPILGGAYGATIRTAHRLLYPDRDR